MLDCFVHIVTQTNDDRLEECVCGKFQTVPEGFIVFYMQDGDKVSVLAQEHSFTMKREGGTAIEAYFSPEGGSRMELSLGDAKGEIPVETSAYSLNRSQDGFTVGLSYMLGDKNINLKFMINGILEEK